MAFSQIIDAIAITAQVINKLSKRSKMPPCPGRSLLKSFIPIWRLNQDANRSPASEDMQVTSPQTAAINIEISANFDKSTAIQMQKTDPPKSPSTVFEGLMRGASFLF